MYLCFPRTFTQTPALCSHNHHITSSPQTEVRFCSSLPTPLLLGDISQTSQLIYLQNAFLVTLCLTRASKLTERSQKTLQRPDKWKQEVGERECNRIIESF